MTLIASLSLAGIGAAMSLEGGLTRESFHAYVEQAQVPSLVPGQIVILDNLAMHKSAGDRGDCSRRLRGGFAATLPPNLNPIELAFAKLKSTLRAAAARTFETVAAATGPALDAITPADASAFFAHCGYGYSGQLL